MRLCKIGQIKNREKVHNHYLQRKRAVIENEKKKKEEEKSSCGPAGCGTGSCSDKSAKKVEKVKDRDFFTFERFFNGKNNFRVFFTVSVINVAQ